MSKSEKPEPPKNPSTPKSRPVPLPSKAPERKPGAAGIKKPVPPPPAASKKIVSPPGRPSSTVGMAAKNSSAATKRAPRKSSARWWLLFALIVTVPALVIAVLRLFVFQPVYIAGEAMIPFVKKDSHALVNQLAYKSPADINIGDVVAFVPPDEDLRGEPLQGELWVSRVIGLPGEQIAVGEDRLRRNGNAAKRTEVGRRDKRYVSYSESLDDQKSWIVIYDEYVLSGLSEMDTKVPANHFYLMGDNRCSALDSRFIGSIPFDRIRGKVIYTSTQ